VDLSPGEVPPGDQDELLILATSLARSIEASQAGGACSPDGHCPAPSLKDILGVDDELLEAVYGRALVFLRIGQARRAGDLFYVLCAIDGTRSDHWLGHGICLRECGEIDLALTAFGLAARLASGSPAPHLHRLELLLRQERWDEARSALARLDENAGEDDAELLEAALHLRRVLKMHGT